MREIYAELQKKYDLPAYEDLEHDFEISHMEKEDFLLREIRVALMEKLDTIISLLSDILQPDTNSIAAMHEFRAFDDKRKKDIYAFYKHLMVLQRKGLMASITLREDDDAAFINSFYSSWNETKTKAKEIVTTLEHSWNSESIDTSELEYLG